MTSENQSLSHHKNWESDSTLLATDAKEYAVFLVGLDGHLLCWNAGAERMFGYQSNEIIGQHFSRFFSPEDIITGQPEHELTTALANGRADSNCWQVRKDGTRFWCQAIVTPLLDENKQARSFARVMHDLTESEACRPSGSGQTASPKPIGARKNSWPCFPMNSEVLSRRLSTPCKSLAIC